MLKIEFPIENTDYEDFFFKKNLEEYKNRQILRNGRVCRASSYHTVENVVCFHKKQLETDEIAIQYME